MAIYAIADLHLPGGDIKPMDVFGEHWANHFEKISADWRARVSENDIVLLPGDLSWAMQLADAVGDLERLGELPGRKVILRGNHDYWWSGIRKVRDALPGNMWAVQNDCVVFDEAVICGTRGWLLPAPSSTENDEKVYKRELLRLEMTLADAQKRAEGKRVVCMLHYPPLLDLYRDTGFTEILERFGVRDVLYGHLHGAGIRTAFRGEHNGVRYHLVSCDSLGFKLYELPEDDGVRPQPPQEEPAI